MDDRHKTNRKAYDLISDEYDKKHTNTVSLQENEIVFKELRNKVGKRVLDLGCGTGLLLKYITPDKYIGVDFSKNMIAKAKHQFPKQHFKTRDMHDLSFIADSTIDTVVSLFGAFSYSLSPKILVDEINRVLAPEGNIFIMVYGRRYGNNASYKKYTFANTGIKVHYNAYNVNKINNLLSPKFNNIEVYGLNLVADYLPKEIGKRVIKLEHKFLGKLVPNLFRHLIITGNKNLN